MSGRIAKSQIDERKHESLPIVAKEALREAKKAIKSGAKPRLFGNEHGRTDREGPPLPKLSNGCEYYEFPVGAARDGDPKGSAGTMRLVLEVNVKAKEIRNIYYTEHHYAKYTFFLVKQ